MKKLFFKWTMGILFIAALSFSFSSCSNDDKNEEEPTPAIEPTYADLIIGVWSDNGTDKWNEDGSSEDGWDSYGYEFKKDGVCYVHGSIYGPGTYSLQDNNLTIHYTWNESVREYTYTIKKLTEDQLTIHDDHYPDFDNEADETYWRIK